MPPQLPKPFERRAGLRRPRTRSPSPSDQLIPSKRRRTERVISSSHSTSPNRSSRPSSSSANSGDGNISQFYGIGHNNALDNLFASYPQRLSTIPKPQARPYHEESTFEMRTDHDITFSNILRTGSIQPRRISIPIPSEYTDPFLPTSSTPSTQDPPDATRVEFQPALRLIRPVIGEDQYLTSEILCQSEGRRQWREQWGWLLLSSDAYELPPPYSPPRDTRTLTSMPSVNSPHASLVRSSVSPEVEQIPNPPIPGEPAPDAGSLFKTVNAFAKEYGFGIVRRHMYRYNDREIRYTIQYDRFGQPRPGRGAGLRQRKSRKTGCKWQIIAEALEEGK